MAVIPGHAESGKGRSEGRKATKSVLMSGHCGGDWEFVTGTSGRLSPLHPRAAPLQVEEAGVIIPQLHPWLVQGCSQSIGCLACAACPLARAYPQVDRRCRENGTDGNCQQEALRWAEGVTGREPTAPVSAVGTLFVSPTSVSPRHRCWAHLC